MVIRVFISGISGNKEVKKRQQRVLLILDSKNIKYDVVDIAEPGSEEDKDFMQNSSTSNGATISDPNPRHPLPPQIFNDDVYCGDYDMFDMANEVDEMEKFLKLAPDDSTATVTSTTSIQLENGNAKKDVEVEDADSSNAEIENTNEEVPKDEVENVEESKENEIDDNKESEDAKADENQTDEQKLENGANHDKVDESGDNPDEDPSEKAEES
ncbi:SH3 domain-binding glutamic acid-rich protein homolog [Aethina tumida]|uniref:SH3 domain-binding glutamic acid-rich protein homolog n=1 Tax=Aethina tumida TaxID=116153 RepID=UPI00096B2672|nr:SH3 domain-binding glutamic acid-rich protein homolog [Aethina tumida]